ncbi:MAG TPA: tetratricopeptide repeat protein [Acidiferrobacteraceae bacterium]|nr:tetratricopeptide repeat protein [Acidiferrobacteraceae bacterium]
MVHTLPLPIKKDRRIRDLRTHLDFIQAAETAPGKETLLARIADDAENLEARYLLAATQLVDNDYPSALDQLAEILQRDPTFRDDMGERGLRAIFAILNEEEELLAPYRHLLQTRTH